MNYEDAKNYAKSQIESYLQGLGINTQKNFRCLTSEHEDNHPSMSFNRNTNSVHCFACGANGDIFDVVGWVEGITDPSEKFRRTYEILGIDVDGNDHSDSSFKSRQKKTKHEVKLKEQTPKKNYTKLLQYAHEQIGKTNYFKDRGLSDQIIEKAKLGYIPDFKVKIKNESGKYQEAIWQAAVIPRGSDRYTIRKISGDGNSRDKARKFGPGKSLYAIHDITKMLADSAPIYIVEGEIDALSIEEVGGRAIAIGSTSYTDALVSTLKESKKERRLKSPVILCLDNDEAGQNAQKKLAQLLKKQCIHGYLFNIYGKSKDANEALLENREKLKEKISLINRSPFEYAEAVKKEKYRTKLSAGGHIQEFINGIKIDTPCYQTGFKKLNRELDGGFYEGIYILSSQTSCGKTTLAEQIVESMVHVNPETDVLIFSLEMSWSEMMAKSISKITFEKTFENQKYSASDAKTVHDITSKKRYLTYSDKEKNLIKLSIESYATYADHIFIFEGMADIGTNEIREIVEKHIKVTGNHRVIILVDYLQILSPFDLRATDKQAADHNIIALKRLSRDCKIPIFVISSQNRMSYSRRSELQNLKESGALEYSADVVLGLNFRAVDNDDFDINNEKAKTPREMDLTILKQRNGRTGQKINFDYYPQFNYFEEIP